MVWLGLHLAYHGNGTVRGSGGLVRASEGPGRGSIGKAKGPEEADMGLVEGHRTSSPLRIGAMGPKGELC